MPKEQPGWVKSSTTKNQLETVWRDPKEIIMYAKNSKLHPQEQIQQIANSIVEFGFLDPIAIDENGEILEGHGRYLASVEILKLKSVPTIQILGLTDAQKVAYRVAHNKLTMNSDFDPDLLKLDLGFLNEMDFNLTLTGFDAKDLTCYLEESCFDYQEREQEEDQSNSNNVREIKENTQREAKEAVEDNIPMSSVRMAQLFLNTETHPLFLEMTDKLSEIYGTDNPTDCVMAGLKELCENHSIEIQIT